MEVQEKRKAAGDKKVSKKLTPQEATHALFADIPRLLEYYRVAVPPCRLRQAVRSHHKWAVPKETSFPVAMYDKRGVIVLAVNESKLLGFLEKYQNAQTALLFEVAPGSRFGWIEFEKGLPPKIMNAKYSRVHKVDESALERLERVNNLFFGDGFHRLRLQCAVYSDGRIKLMCGVIPGY